MLKLVEAENTIVVYKGCERGELGGISKRERERRRYD